MGKNYKIAFLGWNPFQLAHVKPLLKALPDSVFLLEQRKSTQSKSFSESLMVGVSRQVVHIKPSMLRKLDGEFDILVCQTPFKQLHLFAKTSIAMIQYGYAKEPHNYGAWRSFADVNLTYGEYARSKISPFSPSVSVGHPRFDQWYDASFHQDARLKVGRFLDPSKKTILYAPTWGDLSSVAQYASAIASLAEHFNVIVKLHHNSILLERSIPEAFQGQRSLHFFGLETDIFELLSVSDAVISDYSGAIFDGVLCEKPVFLLNIQANGLSSDKMDQYSLEFSSREKIGIVINEPKELKDKVNDYFLNNHVWAYDWRSTLFLVEHGAVDRAVSALAALGDGLYQPSQAQLYIRKEMKKLYAYENKGKFVSVLSRLDSFFR